jgi:hypothetical protein
MSTRYRMPVGFSLAYYLIGAVLLDFNAAKLHTMTARGQNMLIGDVSSIPEAVKREVRARRYLYWTMLGRYLFFHVWSLAVASSLLWVFDSTEESTILFLAYVFSYTGSFTEFLIKEVLLTYPRSALVSSIFPFFHAYCEIANISFSTPRFS